MSDITFVRRMGMSGQEGRGVVGHITSCTVHTFIPAQSMGLSTRALHWIFLSLSFHPSYFPLILNSGSF